MLKQADPCGAVVVDGRWNLLPQAVVSGGPPNQLRLLLHPKGIRDRCVNWSQLARAMVGRVHREIAATQDDGLRRLLDELLAYESFFPADEATDVLMRQLGSTAETPA